MTAAIILILLALVVILVIALACEVRDSDKMANAMVEASDQIKLGNHWEAVIILDDALEGRE